MQTITLTLEAVKEAARKAYAEGRLGFQKGEDLCEYIGRRTGSPCAVGAAMPQEFREFLQRELLNGQSFSTLVREGYIDTPNKEVAVIQRIQLAHDEVVQREGTVPYFLRLIDWKD